MVCGKYLQRDALGSPRIQSVMALALGRSADEQLPPQYSGALGWCAANICSVPPSVRRAFRA